MSKHIGDALQQLAERHIVTWRSGLPLSQCRHLGAWLQTGGPLEGVTTLRLEGVTTLRLLDSGEEDDSDDEDAESDDVVEVDLTPLRSGETRWSIEFGVNAEIMTVLARIITFHGALTALTNVQ